MENVINDTSDESSKYLKRDDPLYPCNVVDDKYRAQCYLMQTSHMLALFDGDFGKVFGACNSVEAKHQVSCYQSLGRDASGWSYGSIEDVIGYCDAAQTSEQRAECFAGAGTDFIQSHGVEKARELCRSAGNAERPCSEAVEYAASTL